MSSKSVKNVERRTNQKLGYKKSTKTKYQQPNRVMQITIRLHSLQRS